MKNNRSLVACALIVLLAALLTGCTGASGQARSDVVRVSEASSSSQEAAGQPESQQASQAVSEAPEESVETSWNDLPASVDASESASASASSSASAASDDAKALAEELRSKLDISKDFRESFVHGPKPARYQKYIMLHDTEGDGDASGVVDYWDSSGNGVAAHFIVNKDGSIVQCVPLNKITHHAGFGDTGHNELYEVEDESRDDKVGTTEIGDWAADYGMNSYSIGIEMVHVGGEGDYPEEQLEAVDGLIAYIDAYYGFESQIIDHKAWRSGNSDTSEEFADYLANFQDHRTHLDEAQPDQEQQEEEPAE